MNFQMDFVTGKIKNNFWIMFLPMLIAMFLNIAYNLVDSLWIGNLLGERAYAALTVSTPIILILTSLAMGSTNGISILLSNAIGAKDKKNIDSILATSFVLAILFSMFLTTITEFFLPAILHLLNTTKETYSMAYEYLFLYLLAFPCVYLYCYFTAVLRSYGNSMFQMVAMLFCTILNALINPLFIHFIGFKGSALATVLSQFICLVFMILYIMKKHIFTITFSTFEFYEIKSLFAKAIPSAFQQSIPAISTSFLTSLVSSVSLSALAAYGVSGKLETILFYPSMAMNMVLTTIIGQCLGAKRIDRGLLYIKYALKIGTLLLTSLSVLVVIFARPLSFLFLRSSAVADIVAIYFEIIGIGYILNMLSNIFLGTLNGLSKPAMSMLLMVFYYIIIRMPLSYILLHSSLYLHGIWIAIFISHVVACITAMLLCNYLLQKEERKLYQLSNISV